MFEYFLAKRYIKSKHKINLITIISMLSATGITIGVAALIVVISVFNGFGELVTNTLLNFDPHIRVSVLNRSADLQKAEKLFSEIDEITAFSSFKEGKVILSKNRRYQIIELKGVPGTENKSSWGIHKTLYRGKFTPDNTKGYPQIAINSAISSKLGAAIGDTINVMSFNDLKKSISGFSLLRGRRFVVSGFFETNNREYDLKYAFTSVRGAQRVLGGSKKLSGFEIRLDKVENSEKIKQLIASKLPAENFSIKSWYDLHKDLYTMMKVERWAGFIILCLIIAVATFNILGSLTMSVIEKKKDIGILKSMGATNKMVLRIFMIEGVLIGVIGTLLGVSLGLFICFLQNEFNFYSLDITKYVVEALPLRVDYFDVVIIALTSIILSSLASLYPAKRAVKISTIDVIKWE
ncbi:MAG: FtsX-like permease family protein [Rhodothermaceae bacterium]